MSTAEGYQQGRIWHQSGARVTDGEGKKRLPIGVDGFEKLVEQSVFVDKTLLVKDVLDARNEVTLFCRPRRFGKTLAMTMLKAFLELPPDGKSRAHLFEGLEIWDADDGRYRADQGCYPTIYLSLNNVKKLTWEEARGQMAEKMAGEYQRHSYLASSPALDDDERAHFARVSAQDPTDADLAASLARLARYLFKHYGKRTVVLIDEYDAPMMAGYTYGYYDEVVGFMKSWLTGALKDGGAALAFSCMTGVQRISKESIFSDLNNPVVLTPLNTRSNERFGFTQADVEALAGYLDRDAGLSDLREWYDGYRFGNVDIYNPWSVLNYFFNGCATDVYWGNTSDNSVVRDLVANASPETLADVHALLQPGGTVAAPLDLSVVFPDIGVREDAVWSTLYLAGYLTTEDVEAPNDTRRRRRLRVPNREVAALFSREVIERSAAAIGGTRRLYALQDALVAGDAPAFEGALSHVLLESASYHDLTTENSYHMLLLGMLFGILGYHDPVSNREAGHGRYDIRLDPIPSDTSGVHCDRTPLPAIVIEMKWVRPADAANGADDGNGTDARLRTLAADALAQIAERAYDHDVTACNRLHWGVAFCGKRVAVACEQQVR